MSKQSDAAAMLGRLRWKGRSKAERTAHAKMMRAARTTKQAKTGRKTAI